MKRLTGEEILALDDLKTEDVEIPEWNSVVTVRELTGSERDEWESSIVIVQGTEVKTDSKNLRAKLVALSVIDEKGERIFTMKQVAQLGKKSAAALDRIVDVAKKLSGIGKDELETLGNE